jgi:hypothetical protein
MNEEDEEDGKGQTETANRAQYIDHPWESHNAPTAGLKRQLDSTSVSPHEGHFTTRGVSG